LFHGITDTALPAEGGSTTYTFFSKRFLGAFIGQEFQFPAIPFNPSSRSADIKQQARLVHETLLTQQNTREVRTGVLARMPVTMLIRSRVTI